MSSTSISENQRTLVLLTPPSAPLGDLYVRELIESERNYVYALDMIIHRFARPMEILLKRDENLLIFGHIRQFYYIHSIFHDDLIRAAYKLCNRDLPIIPPLSKEGAGQTASNPTTPTIHGGRQFFSASPLSSARKTTTSRPLKISTCFLNMKEEFLKYGEYCATLSKAQSLVDELTNKNEAISALLDQCQQKASDGKFKLRDLLSLPMQRILKYHLLLAKMISSTNDDHQGLKRAYDAMVDLGQYINEVKRDTETMQIINEIEQSIFGLNIQPDNRLIDFGRLVTDGFIRVRAPQESKTKSAHELSKIKLQHDAKLKKRYVFVFDKMVLLCKSSDMRRHQYKEALYLSEYELDLNPIMSNDFHHRHSIRDKWSYTFDLYRTYDRNTYSFYTKTLDMKTKWANAIQRAIDNDRPSVCRTNNSSHEFAMHTFEKASYCDHCGKLLLGLYFQGYRCKICTTSVHKRCLSSVRACGSAKSSPFFFNSQHESNELSIRSLGGDESREGPELVNSYVNFPLRDQPWYNERMDREQAQTLLDEMPHGTFLVRVSPKHHNSHVISLKYSSKVMHMRIYVSKDNQLYLSQNRYFNSLMELVSFYQENSLVECFNMLDAKLILPYKLHKI